MTVLCPPRSSVTYLRGLSGDHYIKRDHGDADLRGATAHADAFERVLVTALRMGGDTDAMARTFILSHPNTSSIIFKFTRPLILIEVVFEILDDLPISLNPYNWSNCLD